MVTSDYVNLDWIAFGESEGSAEDIRNGTTGIVPKIALNGAGAAGMANAFARAAGSYQACFRLKDSEIYEWAGESENTVEVWVAWSIALQEFDPNNDEVTYWGTSSDNITTTVEYTGEPIYVRPWWTPAMATGGKFPEWFTHWGSEDRPTTDRLSSAVFYLGGDDDREGLVGYHTNADGSLEKVTAEQVYAWASGVDVDGEHLPVENGDKVWYKTDDDGWKVPLGVGDNEPEGAEGYIVARDYAYADRLMTAPASRPSHWLKPLLRSRLRPREPTAIPSGSATYRSPVRMRRTSPMAKPSRQAMTMKPKH